MAGLYVLLSTIEPLLRGLRWSILTGSSSRGPAIRGLYIAKAGNNLLPLRMGDALRAQYIRDKAGVPYTRSVASILAESVLDLCLLGLLVLVYAVLAASSRGLVYGIVMLVALPAGAWLAFLAVKRVVSGRSPGSGIAGTISRVIHHLSGILGGGRAPALVSSTVVLWALTLVTSWCGLRIFLPHVTLLGVLSTIVFVYLSVLVPSAPGFVGTYHAAIAGSLAVMGFSLSEYPAAPVLIHLLQFLPHTLIGIALGVRYLFSNDWGRVRSDFAEVRRSLLGRKA
jgi:hypothetical protein